MTSWRRGQHTSAAGRSSSEPGCRSRRCQSARTGRMRWPCGWRRRPRNRRRSTRAKPQIRVFANQPYGPRAGRSTRAKPQIRVFANQPYGPRADRDIRTQRSGTPWRWCPGRHQPPRPETRPAPAKSRGQKPHITVPPQRPLTPYRRWPGRRPPPPRPETRPARSTPRTRRPRIAAPPQRPLTP